MYVHIIKGKWYKFNNNQCMQIRFAIRIVKFNLFLKRGKNWINRLKGGKKEMRV